jgi:hypothetical protein
MALYHQPHCSLGGGYVVQEQEAVLFRVPEYR